MDNKQQLLHATYQSLLQSLEKEFTSRPNEDWELLHNHRLRGVKETLRDQIGTVPVEFKERLKAEFLGVGPLGSLIEDPEVSEILLTGADKVYFESEGSLKVLKETFLGPSTFQRFFYEVLDESKIVVNLNKPYGDGMWRGFRVHTMVPPLSEDFCLSLRRQKLVQWNMDELIGREWACSELAHQLIQEFQAGKSFIIYGDTGSGKTAVAEAFLKSLPSTCRTIILEDTRELRTPNAASLRLLTRPRLENLEEVTYQDLLRQALRMRPDRLMMGEIRGSEAKDFLMVLSAGHRGGLATLHAESAHKALLRLEMLIQLGAPQWDLRSVRLLISHSVDYLLKVGRDPNGTRKLLSVHRIDGFEETGLLLEEIGTRY